MSLAAHTRRVNESLVKHLIRDVADPESLDLAAGLIADRLAGKPDLPEIEAVIMEARRDFAPLFKGGSRAVMAGSPTTPPAATEAPNPFAKATWNLTKQTLMQRDNPAKAARLKAEAAR